jgi:hypothetical protein
LGAGGWELRVEEWERQQSWRNEKEFGFHKGFGPSLPRPDNVYLLPYAFLRLPRFKFNWKEHQTVSSPPQHQTVQCEGGIRSVQNFFVSFDYSSDAMREAEAVFKRSHKFIVALTV